MCTLESEAGRDMQKPVNDVVQRCMSMVVSLALPSTDRGVPKHRPTATLTAWSSIRRPREEIGRASSQALDSFAEEASRLARA